MNPIIELTSSGFHLHQPTSALLLLTTAPAVAFLHTAGRPFLVRALDALVKQACRFIRFLASVRIHVTTR